MPYYPSAFAIPPALIPVTYFSCGAIFRFVLEPVSVLMDEQEKKLKDGEAAITSLQV